MFKQINPEQDIDSITKLLEDNCEEAKQVRTQIRELQQAPSVEEREEEPKREERKSVEEVTASEEAIDELAPYIGDYHLISGDDVESMITLLPDPDSYEYANVIYRLQAESLKEIKELIEYIVEDPSVEEELREQIENERKKINLLGKLLQTEEEKEEQEVQRNNIILAPTGSGRIRVLDDIDSIPREYYGKITDLIQSIIDGSFRRFKRFFLNTNAILADMAEVKGNGIRVVFKRLNKDTYALVTTFIKRCDNDRGYRDNMASIAGEYGRVEPAIMRNLANPEFMALQDEYVKEMWNRLGIKDTTGKTYGKGGKNENTRRD